MRRQVEFGEQPFGRVAGDCGPTCFGPQARGEKTPASWQAPSKRRGRIRRSPAGRHKGPPARSPRGVPPTGIPMGWHAAPCASALRVAGTRIRLTPASATMPPGSSRPCAASSASAIDAQPPSVECRITMAKRGPRQGLPAQRAGVAAYDVGKPVPDERRADLENCKIGTGGDNPIEPSAAIRLVRPSARPRSLDDRAEVAGSASARARPPRVPVRL